MSLFYNHVFISYILVSRVHLFIQIIICVRENNVIESFLSTALLHHVPNLNQPANFNCTQNKLATPPPRGPAHRRNRWSAATPEVLVHLKTRLSQDNSTRRSLAVPLFLIFPLNLLTLLCFCFMFGYVIPLRIST